MKQSILTSLIATLATAGCLAEFDEGEPELPPFVLAEAGGRTNPTAMTLPIVGNVDITSKDDVDCFSFMVPSSGTLTVTATSGNCAHPNQDTWLELWGGPTLTTRITQNDDISSTNLCSKL